MGPGVAERKFWTGGPEGEALAEGEMEPKRKVAPHAWHRFKSRLKTRALILGAAIVVFVVLRFVVGGQ